VSKLRVRQVRSGLGAPRKMRRTLEALGLKHQRTVEKPDNPAVRGMLFHVKHLVEVEPISDATEKGT
jgi:large subunit ribosomal protein L30